MDPATMFAGAFGTVFALFAIVLMVAVYMLPAIVAYKRRHHNKLAILLLNLLAGWSFIGWLVSMVWACTKVQAE